MATTLRRLLLALQANFITDTGVDYSLLRLSREFAAFKVAALELQSIDLMDLVGSVEAMPFYLNIYNCLIIHATVTMDMPSTSLGRMRFYNRISYKFGRDWVLSANDIEHGILRANSPAPGTLLHSTYWRSSEPRAALALETLDPRLHFALNCGARSCPPIRVFAPKNIERALQLAAEGFLRDTVVWDAAKNTVALSRILSWYHGDFPKPLLDWVCTFLEEDHPLQTDKNAKTKIVYSAYDWAVNDARKDTDVKLGKKFTA